MTYLYSSAKCNQQFIPSMSIQNTPFLRKLKFLKKNLQRTGDLSEIINYFKDMGVLPYIHNNADAYWTLNRILKLTQPKSKRFKRLCKRIGKCAKRKNQFVLLETLLFCVQNNNKYQDPREIVFIP